MHIDNGLIQTDFYRFKSVLHLPELYLTWILFVLKT